MTQMNIVERLSHLISPTSFRSAAIEYGAAPESINGNTLFNYETNNWRVLCIQSDKECCEETRIYRRFVINKDCSSRGEYTIENILSQINIKDVKIFLIKNTPHLDLLHVIQGFNLIQRKTEIVCIQQEESQRNNTAPYLLKNGFKFLERVLVSDIFIKNEQFKLKQNTIKDIFEV